MENLPAEKWLEEAAQAATELAETTFQCEAGAATFQSGLPHGMEGSLLPVQHGQESLHVGLFSTPEGCARLTAALLGMEEGEEPGEEDIPDAIGEIVNILAGIMQRSLDDSQEGPLSLGLPIFVRGDIYAPHSMDTHHAHIDLGPATAQLIIMRGELTHSRSHVSPSE